MDLFSKRNLKHILIFHLYELDFNYIKEFDDVCLVFFLNTRIIQVCERNNRLER